MKLPIRPCQACSEWYHYKCNGYPCDCDHSIRSHLYIHGVNQFLLTEYNGTYDFSKHLGYYPIAAYPLEKVF